jgi:REP element-mobilizing transposase RayT
MARPLRLDYPDTFYHVLSRGNEKRDIFYDEKDYLKFLDTLGRMVARFKLEVHAYILMKNHYHLLVRTKAANLSRGIQWLSVSYSVWFNRRHERSGHLFQGRFKSFLIENDQYFTAMCHYIHGNPLRACIVKRLSDYRWSSYQTYADKNYQESWLTTDFVLSMCGGSRNGFVKEQRLFLEKSGNLLSDLRYGLYFGSEEFAEECIQRAKKERHREKPQARFLLKSRDINTLTCQIIKRLGESEPASVLNTRKRRSRIRDIAIYILYHLGVYRNEEIGRVFGVGYTAVTEAVKRGEQYLNLDKQLERKARKILIDI